MGTQHKVYLTNMEQEALEVLQDRTKKAGGNDATNAILKGALREVLFREGILAYKDGLTPELDKILYVNKEPVPVAAVRTMRRRRRAGK
jgi:hypothetical protein